MSYGADADKSSNSGPSSSWILKNTGWLEFIAVLSGIVSVWYSRKEDILGLPYRPDQYDGLYLAKL